MLPSISDSLPVAGTSSWENSAFDVSIMGIGTFFSWGDKAVGLGRSSALRGGGCVASMFEKVASERVSKGWALVMLISSKIALMFPSWS